MGRGRREPITAEVEIKPGWEASGLVRSELMRRKCIAPEVQFHPSVPRVPGEAHNGRKIKGFRHGTDGTPLLEQPVRSSST